MKRTFWILITAFTLSCLGGASAEAATGHGKALSHQAAKKHGKKHHKKHKHKKHKKAARKHRQ